MAARRHKSKKTAGKKRRERLLGLAAVVCALAVLTALILAAFTLPRHFLPRPEPTEPSPIPAAVYGPSDFAFRDDFLTCLAGPSAPGIDVSSHQGDIDWKQVSASGVRFAMVRVGYRGYETGTLHIDEKAVYNLTEARKAGLAVGAYFFSQATGVEEAREEATLALQVLEGISLDLPLTYDYEYIHHSPARTDGMSKRAITDCALAFCDAAAQAGYQPMVYFNRDLAANGLLLEELTQYPFWLAMYDAPMTYPHRVRMWQYTDEGSVPGIEGDVDLNIYLP